MRSRPSELEVTGPGSRPDFPFVDGLRAMAALSVVAFHASLYLGFTGDLAAANASLATVLSFGYLGVSAFIVISGFVLTLPFTHGDTLSGIGGTRKFLLRRLRRIYPPYLCALGLSLLLIALVPIMQDDNGTAWQGKVPVTWDGILSHALLVHNLSADWISQANGPLWSIAVEFQFYAIMPVVILPAMRRIGLWKTCSLVAIVCLFPIIIGDYLVYSHPWLLLCFCFGIMSAVCARGRGHWIRNNWPGMLFGLPMVLVALAVASLMVGRSPWFWASEVVMGACVGVALSILGRQVEVGRQSFARSVLTRRWLSFFGRASYSIYLVHAPILALLNLSLLEAGLDVTGYYYLVLPGTMTVAVGSGLLFYWVIERRFLSRHQRSMKASVV